MFSIFLSLINLSHQLVKLFILYSWNEVYKDVNGVTWVDDSKATNAEATYAGLMGLRRQKSVILLGGVAKVTIKSSYLLHVLLMLYHWS